MQQQIRLGAASSAGLSGSFRWCCNMGPVPFPLALGKSLWESRFIPTGCLDTTECLETRGKVRLPPCEQLTHQRGVHDTPVHVLHPSQTPTPPLPGSKSSPRFLGKAVLSTSGWHERRGQLWAQNHFGQMRLLPQLPAGAAVRAAERPQHQLEAQHAALGFPSLNGSFSVLCSAVFFVTYLILACCSGPR